MKKLIIACFMCFGAVAALHAQDTTSISSDQYQTDDMNQGQGTSQGQAQEDGSEIAASELPAAIQQQLQTQDYSGWTVSNVHRKMKDGETVYKVKLTNGQEEKKVKFDEQGNELKDKDKKQDTY